MFRSVDAPRPHLWELFEAAAAAMELDHGQQRLELVFADGSLRAWWSHSEKRTPGELGRFDVAIAELIARARTPADRAE